MKLYSGLTVEMYGKVRKIARENLDMIIDQSGANTTEDLPTEEEYRTAAWDVLDYYFADIAGRPLDEKLVLMFAEVFVLESMLYAQQLQEEGMVA